MSAMPQMARPGNTVSLRHGALSERALAPQSTVEKRRLLRQVGLRLDDLESVGKALLQNWARAAAALSLMDRYAQEVGWLDGEGNPRGFARLYVSMLNSERLALRDLEKHIRAANTDAATQLREYLRERHG